VSEERPLQWPDGHGVHRHGVQHLGGGLLGAGKVVAKTMFARCTAPLLPSAPPAAFGSLRQTLNVQLGRLVARQLDAIMIVSTEPPAWWSAALPPTPALTAAGNLQW